MATEDIIRLLAESKDVHAMLALKRHAMRIDDKLLLEYVQETAKARLLELRLETELWENCAEYTMRGIGPALVLTQIGQKKIQVIKVARSLTKLGLKEAKALVDNTPSVVVNHIGIPSQAEAAVRAFTEVGATAVWDDPNALEGKFGGVHRGYGVDHLVLDHLPGYG